MEKKNPFSEASKERRRLLNERNSNATKNKTLSKAEKRNLSKEQLIDLSTKDAHSPKGLYQ
jgi:hypothetical protein